MMEAQRPLVIRFGALGDMVLLTPLLDALSRRWGAPCDVIAGAGGAPREILAGLASVGEVVTIRSRRRPFPLSPEQWRLVDWIRRRPCSPTFVIEDLEKVYWLLDRGGVPQSLRVSVRNLERGDLEHAVDYYRRLANLDPPAAEPVEPVSFQPFPRLAVSEAEETDATNWIEGRGWHGLPLVLVQTQSRRKNRGRWPAENWRETILRILARLPEARVLLIGSPAEDGPLRELAAACGDARVVNTAPDIPLRRLIALCAHAHSYVGLDSGPAHIAATRGCPEVVLFGRADPRRNRPLGPAGAVRVVATEPDSSWPATRRAWEEGHSVTGITVENVIEAWHELIEERSRESGRTEAPPAGMQDQLGGR